MKCVQKKKSFQIKEISVENEVSTYYDETKANIDSYDYWEMIVWQYGIHRFFSKTHRERMANKDTHVEVDYPYMGKSVDEHIVLKGGAATQFYLPIEAQRIKYVYSVGSCARLFHERKALVSIYSRNQGLPYCLTAQLWVYAVNI